MSDEYVRESKTLTSNIHVWFTFLVLMLTLTSSPQRTAAQSAVGNNDSNVRPPITKADLQIVQQARKILDSPSKWNRADNRECPPGAKTFSLYCALEKAMTEVSGNFEHRGAALQEARFVIDEIAADRNYNHRLMDYNNDPTTTFPDIQEVFRITESLISLRLKGGGPKTGGATAQSVSAPGGSESKPAVTKADIEIAKRARQILDSPSKWDHSGTQDCPVDAKIFSLYCALVKAAIDVNGVFDNGGAAIREARNVIDETAPNRKSYGARLVDFNNDPTTRFADIQKLLQLVEERLTKRLADNGSK